MEKILRSGRVLVAELDRLFPLYKPLLLLLLLLLRLPVGRTRCCMSQKRDTELVVSPDL